ncbi:unnamed protein product [Candida verbasci]|uniref:Enoyl reductase (ER) domain-containing protein n=1 Tax=Candida verbasci TaxID=1227364 RepID=A0A9W4TVN8_9ASCO|nr:unnamed protein product [Candida verbasci]
MSVLKVNQLILKNAPEKSINSNLNESNSTYELKEVLLPDLKDGEVLIKTLYLSNDPTQRSWMRKPGNKTKSYSIPVYEGTAMASLGLGEIVESKSSNYNKGDIINGRIYWGDYSIIPDKAIFNKVDNSQNLPLEYYLSVLGMTSLTALFGLIEVGKLRKNLGAESGKGPIVAVSAASGAVGSVVVQLAKNLLGARKVIGVTGSDEKVKWVKELGADLAVNYKNSDWKKQIVEDLGDEEIDVYFDNVGGEILSFFLTQVKQKGSVVACGAISGYNDNSKFAVTTWPYIITQRIHVEGFIVSDFIDQFPEAVGILTKAIKEGELRTTDAYHVEDIKGDLAKIPKVWELLFSDAKPNGKLITRV